MILQIPAILRDTLGIGLAHQSTGVVRIQTTRPVYLVFDGSTRGPRWVVRIGPRDVLRPAHETLEQLETLSPGLVPHSLYCGPCGDSVDWVHIQSGVDGVPWFRLRSLLRSAAEWHDVKRAACDALIALHDGIRRNDSWAVSVDVEEELTRQLDALHRAPELEELWAAAFRQIASFPKRSSARIDSIWQHGDFCLNNLLLQRSHAAVIDFDEFHLTAVPLHDEFGLALSFADLIPETSGETLEHHLAFVLTDSLRRAPILNEHLEALFLHHLLWRIGQCARLGRASARRWLLQQLERFVNVGSAVFTPTRRAVTG